VLTEEEKELAYAYNVKIAQKFADFWIDKDMKSVNLWEKGRKADPYMDKGRILGENLSLSMQLINVFEVWKEAGFEDKVPVKDFDALLAKLPSHYFVRFAQGEYDRGLAIIRDGKHVINLPLVSGGNHQYSNTPYFPIPNEIFMLGSSPAEKHPILIPRITVNDGSVLMPLAYMKDIVTAEDGDKYYVSYWQDEMCLMGEADPRKDKRLKTKVTYTFTPGTIVREEAFFPDKKIKVSEIYLEFVTYSDEPKQLNNKISFGKGDLYEFELFGMENCSIEKVEGIQAYKTPHGALNYKVSWKATDVVMEEPFTIKWVLKYK